jgi:iron complex transport system ATP-binding protein
VIDVQGDRRAGHHTLVGEHLHLAYDKLEVARDLTVDIPPGKITVIVGANACGKSTLLRALARLLKPQGGVVLLDGESIQRLPTKEVAVQLGILPQSPIAPEGITVADLVARGRYPHQKWFRQWSKTDEEIITQAMVSTGTVELASRPVDELSGGQRQRVWIAMSLAQGTDILLLDEPTTFLDPRYQVEILDLLRDLADRHGVAVGVVLHDLNQAAAIADQVVLLHQGRVRAAGRPHAVFDEDLLTEVYGIRIEVATDPDTLLPTTRPVGRHTYRATARP